MFVIQRLQTFDKYSVINAFINVHYLYWYVCYIYGLLGILILFVNVKAPASAGDVCYGILDKLDDPVLSITKRT